MAQPIKDGDSGPAVKAFQQRLNDRLKAKGLPRIDDDGDCGRETLKAAAHATWFLGGLMKTVKAVDEGFISRGVLKLIAHPDGRSAGQLARAKERRGKPYPLADVHKVGALEIISCAQWGAQAPRGAIARVGRPTDIIFHHTDGHTPGPSAADAASYARSIQIDHFSRGYVDSGHNFLVTRSGLILEGRHGSLAAVSDGVMVQSAHCPGKNRSPGIEHEHRGEPSMTPAQRTASLNLHEFICRKTGINPKNVFPHGDHFATSCPAELRPSLPAFRADLAERLA